MGEVPLYARPWLGTYNVLHITGLRSSGPREMYLRGQQALRVVHLGRSTLSTTRRTSRYTQDRPFEGANLCSFELCNDGFSLSCARLSAGPGVSRRTVSDPKS